MPKHRRQRTTKRSPTTPSRPVGALLTVFLAVFPLSLTGVAQTPDFEGPAFSTDPASLLQYAGANRPSEEADILILLEDTRYEFKEDGRSTRTRRLIYQILSETGLQDWSAVSASWKPWYQERPLIEARVITPDGSERFLDPKTVSQASERSDSQEIYIDTQSLQAPLPAVANGAIVETRVITDQSQPPFDRGVVQRLYVGDFSPTLNWKLSVRSPDSLPIENLCRHCPEMEVQRTESEGFLELAWTAGPLPGWDDPAADLAPEDVAVPYFAFSTGTSWESIARRYSEILEEALGRAELGDLLDGIASDLTIRERVEMSVARLHRRIRYTGVEFDQASFIPRSPSETIARGYGDCKDKSALLIAMLRGLWEELETVIDVRKGYRENDLAVARAEYHAAMKRGQHERVSDLLEPLIELGRAEPVDLNNLVWSALFLGQPSQETVQTIERALIQSSGRSGVHTAAAIYASVGRVFEARELLLEHMRQTGLDEPDGDSWYILGLIAENLGELEAARTAYQRVDKPDGSILDSSFHLAQTRLRAISN